VSATNDTGARGGHAASALGLTPVELQMARILVSAGATHASAARATVMLRNGATIDQAREACEFATEAARFDAELLFAELFQSEIAISRENGGGGNRTRVRSRTA